MGNMSERAFKAFDSRKIPEEHILKLDALKEAAANLWDCIDDIYPGLGIAPTGNSEAGRLVSLAKTDLESSVMWAVKAFSRQ